MAHRDGALAGWAVLRRDPDPVVAHWGRVTHVQSALDARGTGVGRALMVEVARLAREEMGLELLRLEVRGYVEDSASAEVVVAGTYAVRAASGRPVDPDGSTWWARSAPGLAAGRSAPLLVADPATVAALP